MKLVHMAYATTAASVALSGSSTSPHGASPMNCNVADIQLHLPAEQTVLSPPNVTLSYVALGLGVQNYTCSNTSTWTNVGAVAELFDISCLYNTPLFDPISNAAFAAWNVTPEAPLDLISAFSGNPIVLGQHYFIPSPTGSGVSPKFDFTSAREKGHPEAFVVGAKVGDLPAPTGKGDVDWLQLKSVQGELASTVYRLQTRGGQPPASCKQGSPPLSVKYAAQYWFFGSSLTK
ncbi:hypothetical protein NEOLEDRAFT_1241563 [Neolentinus lepideus HHB14362 ss-1]|uniref:Malate dehydrogenase n=1 Tax=Neolentinus lepideus HHB14362 ss-1 TaxID=1314782 RepID=A0A165SU97_9AGAM|nr:hypothetical protein NEOLEDRAFT_1241563 [Neolentinus lepideus HHB14362 ss-1]